MHRIKVYKGASTIANKTVRIVRVTSRLYTIVLQLCFLRLCAIYIAPLAFARLLFYRDYYVAGSGSFYTRGRNNVSPLFLTRKTVVNALSSIARAPFSRYYRH